MTRPEQQPWHKRLQTTWLARRESLLNWEPREVRKLRDDHPAADKFFTVCNVVGNVCIVAGLVFVATAGLAYLLLSW